MFGKYLKDILNMHDTDSVVNAGEEITADDRILTLSTCVSGSPDKRFPGQVVQLKDGPGPKEGRPSAELKKRDRL